MPDRAQGSRAAAPTTMESRAAEDLRFIRRTMAESTTFTAVPGRGGIVMGVIGLAAAAIASRQPSPEQWLGVWLAAACVGSLVGLLAMRQKAAGAGIGLTGAAARRFGVSLAAPLVAGGVITFGLQQVGAWNVIGPAWLLLYGAGAVTGGAFSIAAVRLLGVCFMLLGTAAMLTPTAWGDVWLALGFGVLQIVFGVVIARRHGG